MKKRVSRDFLSDLPLSIIHSILERVPIRDVVRTSILSWQWRYIWSSLPHLDFDTYRVSFSGETASNETKMINFINQFLLLHKGPIHKFKLHVSFKEDCPIEQWLLYLSRKDIRIISLISGVYDDGYYYSVVHSSVYSCQNLSRLDLGRCEFPPPPPFFKEFLNLRSLILYEVLVSSRTIECIVDNSPLLEELILNSCGPPPENSELRIIAPNLKNLRLERGYTELCLYAPLLAKLALVSDDVQEVDCLKDLSDDLMQQKSSVCNYTILLGGITKLEILDGDLFLLKFLSIGIDICQESLVFHHLRVIKLYHICFHDIKVMSVVVRLVTGAPNLQKLKIASCVPQQNASEVGSVSTWDSKCVPNFTFERLKVIKMGIVWGMLDEMKFIKFLLASSPVLEKMTCRPYVCLTDKESLKLTVELLSYRRASTNAQILFDEI